MDEEGRKIKVRAALPNLEPLVDFVIASARDAGLNEQKVANIHLAVDEACTNVINYGYPPGEEGEIELACSRKGDKFIVSIRDRGRPFDPVGAPLPELETDIGQRPIGGLGIFLMKKFSDRIRYRREGDTNHLQIINYL